MTTTATVFDHETEGPFGPEPRHELRRVQTLNAALTTQLEAALDRCERLDRQVRELRRELESERRDSEAALEWMEAA